MLVFPELRLSLEGADISYYTIIWQAVGIQVATITYCVQKQGELELQLWFPLNCC